MLTPNALIRDRYLIVRRTGGKTSAVYDVVDLTTRGHVALKQVIIESRVKEVERAARLLKRVRHPNLPVINDYFVEAANGFLVMDLVPGDDLASTLDRNGTPFSVKQVLGWADQLLDALDYIHTLQPPLIHGDINPQNLKLNKRGEIVLLGFRLPGIGLAVRAGGEHSSSSAFPSPEQFQGAGADQHSDLFALGATLYYLLTGRPPVPAGERLEALASGQDDALVAPHILNPKIPLALSDMLVQALALEPTQQPISAAAMRAALAELRLAEDVSQPAEGQIDTIANMATRLRWPRLAFATAGVVLMVLLVVMVWGEGAFGGTSIAQRPTPQPAAGIPEATSLPTESPQATGTAVPSPTETIPSPVATSMPTASATTMPLPTIAVQVSSIAPQPAYAGALPIVLLLHGQGLDEVRTARLLADGKPSLNAAIQHDADQLVLTIATLPEPLNGEVSYRLELDGTVLETPPIVLRDFLDRQRVQGVLPEYDYTSRVASDAAGAYTRMRVDPNVASQPRGMLRNGDEVDILSTNRDGWYLVRIHTSSDAAQIATVGWIERWLLDNQGVPATPTPAPKRLAFVGRVYSAPIDKAIQCGISFDSSIYGSVENSRGTGIAGARLRVTSADGKNVYNVATGRGGIYSVPGLGCTTWYVSLISVPNAPNGFDANRVPVRNLNGGRFTSAEVRFKQQK